MFENKNSRTELSTLGEFGLIKHIAQTVTLQNPETIKGIGDDAAVIDCGNNQTVITTDLLVEDVHFDLTYCPLKHLGYKAVVVNVSDVYAMNAQPKQVTISLALSNRFSLEAVEEFYHGVALACNKYGVDLIGGDTTTSNSGLLISVTAIGVAKADEIVYRNGAKDTDLICVTGDLGAAYMGLQLLKREKEVFKANPNMQPDFGGYDYLLERQLKPEAQKDVIAQLRIAQIKPTSMMDVSDGLASELHHICAQSNVGCRIYEDKLPIDVKTHNIAEEFDFNPTTAALNGGEDYELLFTIPITAFDAIKNIKDVHIIGHITDASAGLYLNTTSNQSFEIKAQGWDALK
jgi:thiamine-monophosphate kinase